MANINTVTLVGRLVRDIELSYTPAGSAVGSGTLAFDRQVKKAGEYVKESNFVDFSIFGKQAEALKPYLIKGKQIAATGFLKQDRWQDKDTGAARSKISIVFNDVQLVGGRNDGQGYSQDSGAGDYSSGESDELTF